jgi:hypothetical protein
LAAIELGLGRLTPGQVKVADLRRALAAETVGRAPLAINQHRDYILQVEENHLGAGQKFREDLQEPHPLRLGRQSQPG